MPPIKILTLSGLGTIWYIEYDQNLDLDVHITAQITEFEQNYSRFLPTSLLSKLNSDKDLINPPQELIEMLLFALKVNLKTIGIFNPTIGGTLNSLGYGHSETKAKISNFQTAISFLDTSGNKIPHSSLLSPKHNIQNTIYKIQISKSTSLDFGGFGKGWLVDKICQFLKDSGSKHALVNGGGDVMVDSTSDLELALEDPRDSTKSLGHISLKKGAIVSSSTLKRTWAIKPAKIQNTNYRMPNNISYHHIINPNTSQPSNSNVTAVFVQADSCLIADTLATALIIDPSQVQKLESEFNLKTLLL